MIEAYRPEYNDLWFRKLMLSDEKTMSYNHSWGGTIPFPEEDWASWYDHWVAEDDANRYYRFIKDEKGNFIGEIAYHYAADIPGFVANILVYAKYRGKGYGSQALGILCKTAKENGITALYDDIAIDNPAIDLFLGHGFSELYRTEEIIMLKKEL